MSSIDNDKFEQVVASLTNSFSIFSDSAPGIGDGQLISNGISQLENLGEYFNDLGNEEESNEQTPGSLDEYKEQMQEQMQQATEQMYDQVTEQIEQGKLEQYVSVGIDENYQYIKISMYGAILFDSGKAEIKKDAIPILSKIGDILKRYDEYLIKIEGHTDNVPITSSNSYKNNLWLSTARASNVWEYFTNDKGLNPITLESSGRAEFDPIADNSTEEGRRKNRRVEIKIYHDLDH